MFIRKSTRHYKETCYTNYLLVESVHTPKGPRQKVVSSLGDLHPRPRGEWLKLAHRVEDALVGQADWVEGEDREVEEILRKVRQGKSTRGRPRGRHRSEEQARELVAVHTDRVRTEAHREAGPVHVGYQFYRMLGVEEILERVGLNERARRLSCVMTIARLVHPSSEHAMPQWIRSTALADILGVDFGELDDNALYRNLDKLHPNRQVIEAGLVERERTLFNLDQTVLLYDLTSSYFEGQALKNAKARRGYSRDKRPDCKQVVVGLVVNRDGFPVSHEIFEGNIQDRATLGQMLDLLDKRVGLRAGQTVVVDRGMSYQENLEQIGARGLHYVVASRQSEREQWLSEFEDAEGFQEIIRKPSVNNPYQKKPKVEVKLKRSGKESHVLCISSGRTEKDRAIREKQEQRLVSDLAKLDKRVREGRLSKAAGIGEAIGRLKERYPRVARYYEMEYDETEKKFRWHLNAAKREKAEKLDGSYLLKTDRTDLSAEEAWRIYILLTRAENAFRNMKSPLAERPIFHQVERRVETHIFLCVLAYHLLVAIEKRLQDKGVYTSWATVRETLKTHQVSTIVLPTDKGAVLRIRKGSTPEPQHQHIYNLLEIPSEPMKPTRTWVVAEDEHSD
jgi:transposase